MPKSACPLKGATPKDDEGRWSDRGFLDYCLRDSAALSDTHVKQILALADRSPGAWPLLIGGWLRDPLIERIKSHREDFLTAARATTGTEPVEASG